MNSYNINFFKPNRQVWQEAEPGTVDSDSSDTKNIEEAGKLEQLLKVSEDKTAYELIKQAREVCDSTETKGVEQHICSLKKISEYKELVRTKKFIDDLYQKFLAQEEEENVPKPKDTFARFKALKDACDMERIMEYFKKAKSYEIILYSDSQIDRNNKLEDQIIFTYKDKETGKKTRKSVKLELALNPPPLVTNYRNEESESITNTRNTERQFQTNEGDFLEYFTSLNTPDAAYKELLIKTQKLPLAFLKDIAEPLANIADIYVAEGVIDEQKIPKTYGMQVKNALRKHFGENYKENMRPEELQDLNSIEGMFGLG